MQNRLVSPEVTHNIILFLPQAFNKITSQTISETLATSVRLYIYECLVLINKLDLLVTQLSVCMFNCACKLFYNEFDDVLCLIVWYLNLLLKISQHQD